MASENRTDYTQIKGGRQLLKLTHIKNIIWLASDHLLIVNRVYFTENYNRLALKDIQSFIIQVNHWRLFNSLFILLGVLIVFLFMLSFGLGTVVLEILMGICLLMLIVNLAKGPCCNVRVNTAVQEIKLASLNRLKPAQKAVALLEQHIQEAQKDIEIQEERPQVSKRKSRDKVVFNVSTSIAPGSGYRGAYHFLLYAVLALNTVFTMFQLNQNGLAISITTTLTEFTAAVLLLIALVKQRKSNLDRPSRIITWCVGAFIMTTIFIVGSGYAMYMSIKYPGSTTSQWEIFKKVAEIDPSKDLVFKMYLMFSMIGSGLCALLGLISLMNFSFVAKRQTPTEKAEADVDERDEDPQNPENEDATSSNRES